VVGHVEKSAVCCGVVNLRCYGLTIREGRTKDFGYVYDGDLVWTGVTKGCSFDAPVDGSFG